MDSLELSLFLPEAEQDIWIAELAETGFDGFWQEAGVLKAFIPADNMDEKAIEAWLKEKGYGAGFEIKTIPAQNWNKLWEESYAPVVVRDSVRIRAPHHSPDEGYEMELIIQPKMSFGTGHHATTSLMLEWMLEEDFEGKRVFDYGSGTGVLAIAAAKLGAKDILAMDYDPQCMENAAENLQLNDAEFIELRLGDSPPADVPPFDITLANINKNILIQSAEGLGRSLAGGGKLLCSGFFPADLPEIAEAFLPFGLHLLGEKAQNGWCAARFSKGSD